tara:strand:- start:3383 stop:3655 length:273 start_codon:yes stop_codon:yes gene_type:complete
MCAGLFGGGSRPAPVVQQSTAAPTVKSASAPVEMPTPEKLKESTGDDEKIDTKKKKALEIKATKQGVKQFGAIDPTALPDSPTGGINTGT